MGKLGQAQRKNPSEEGEDMIGTTIFTPNMMTIDTTANTEIYYFLWQFGVINCFCNA